MVEDTHRALRAAVAAEAEKTPIRVQLMRPKPDFGETVAMAIANVGFGGALLMLGFRAAHEVWATIPPAGYITSVFLFAGLQGIGAGLGLCRGVGQ